MSSPSQQHAAAPPPPPPYSTEYLNVPGVRFVPTDHELIVHFLRPKLHGADDDHFFPPGVVHVADVYGEHPLDLVRRLGESKEGSWYVLSPRRRKYPNGKRPKRDTGTAGFWKATGKNDDIFDDDGGGGGGEQGRHVVGHKRPLTYHVFVDEGQPPSPGRRTSSSSSKKDSRATDWKMLEFVSVDSDKPVASSTTEVDAMLLNDWVLCKITRKEEKKINAGPKSAGHQAGVANGTQRSKSAGGGGEEEEVVVDPDDPDSSSTPFEFPLDFSWDFGDAGTNPELDSYLNENDLDLYLDDDDVR